MNVKLSFIIPFYGNANQELLNRCIKSIKNQGIKDSDYEIIIANDNGRGLGGARNIGLSQAIGKYIIFIDADDYIFQDSLLKCLALIEIHEPDILSFGLRKVIINQSKLTLEKRFSYSTYLSGAEYMILQEVHAGIYFVKNLYLLLDLQKTDTMKMKTLSQKHIALHKKQLSRIIRFTLIVASNNLLQVHKQRKRKQNG